MEQEKHTGQVPVSLAGNSHLGLLPRPSPPRYNKALTMKDSNIVSLREVDPKRPNGLYLQSHKDGTRQRLRTRQRSKGAAYHFPAA